MKSPVSSKEAKVKAKHPQWKAREVHSLCDIKGPLVCWTIYPDQIEAMRDEMSFAIQDEMAKSDSPYNAAIAALKAIGIKRTKGTK